MILKIDGQLVEIDVKGLVWNKHSGRWVAKASTRLGEGVYMVCVNPETEEIRWRKQFGGSDTRPNICPEGLETFWD